MNTPYTEIMQSLRDQFAQQDVFKERGTKAVGTILQLFAEYLQAPPDSCRVSAWDASIEEVDAPPVLLQDAVELRLGGWFSASLLVREPGPLGPVIRFGFSLKFDEQSTAVCSEDEQEFHVVVLDSTSLRPLFDHAVASALAMLKASPEKLAVGDIKPRIGFV